MSFIENFPCFSILFSMFAAIITSATKGKTARKISFALVLVVGLMSALLVGYTWQTGESFVYVMGHFPAPWGNEIRSGMLEAGMALFFCVIMLLSLMGGFEEAMTDLQEDKEQFYYIMVDLLMASLLALVYTNDIFTTYVFVEINTIAACGLIVMKYNSNTVASGVRYMIMSLMGSGLLLLGICFLYDITGHLLMSNIREQVTLLAASGEYRVPLIIAIALMTTGLAIKSALWPFHAWLPNAYGFSTVGSAAMLSSLVSKGYLFILFKIIYRVIGLDVYVKSNIVNILLVFGIIGMILGSVDAIKQTNIRRMIAYSSVAQIGYIFMGIGIGTELGMSASIYHIFAHAASKALLFIAAAGLIKASDGKQRLNQLAGAGYRNKMAGIGFVVGSLSMVGIPGFAGFISKLMFAQASLVSMRYAIPVLLALAVSTILNAVYFMRVVLYIYTPNGDAMKEIGLNEAEMPKEIVKNHPQFNLAIIGFTVLNVFLGVAATPMMQLITNGLGIFG